MIIFVMFEFCLRNVNCGIFSLKDKDYYGLTESNVKTPIKYQAFNIAPTVADCKFTIL